MRKNSYQLSVISYQKKSRLLFIVFLLAVTFTGCGYTTRSMVSDKFRTIYITPFVNKIDITQEAYTANKYRIYRPGIETDVTKAVVNKYMFDGNLKPTKHDSADLILNSELVEFRKDPLRYNDNEEVEEYRINILVNLKLWDTKENKLVWEENNFTGEFTYFPTTATQTNVTKKSDAQATTDAISDLARRIVERTVEQW